MQNDAAESFDDFRAGFPQFLEDFTRPKTFQLKIKLH